MRILTTSCYTWNHITMILHTHSLHVLLSAFQGEETMAMLVGPIVEKGLAKETKSLFFFGYCSVSTIYISKSFKPFSPYWTPPKPQHPNNHPFALFTAVHRLPHTPPPLLSAFTRHSSTLKEGHVGSQNRAEGSWGLSCSSFGNLSDVRKEARWREAGREMLL